MSIPLQNNYICMIAMQKLRCHIKNDASLLDYKDQAFNYSKCILQHETFASIQKVQFPIIRWKKKYTDHSHQDSSLHISTSQKKKRVYNI